MNRFVALLSVSLLSLPALARSKAPAATKAPRNGQFCAKGSVGTTSQDGKGATLECKADKKGKARWTKK